MKRSHKIPKSTNQKPIYIAVIGVIVLLFLIALFRDLKNSLFFLPKGRINVVFYGNETSYFSLGNTEAEDYVVNFYPDIKVPVPGGYGYYRVGGLGKLIEWDHKPDILKRTFSLATSSLADYYFYPQKSEVYHGTEERTQATVPSFHETFFMQSNAGFFDRLYIYLLLNKKRKSNFKNIPITSKKNKEGDQVFVRDSFIERNTGYFFQQRFREERKSIQMIYQKDYVNGERISQILEGEGIRISDVNEASTPLKDCVVRESADHPSATAQALVDFFHCRWRKDKTDIYDIIFELGNREEEWSVD